MPKKIRRDTSQAREDITSSKGPDPTHRQRNDILSLQHTIGNKAVQELFHSQNKEISATPESFYEREAEELAERSAGKASPQESVEKQTGADLSRVRVHTDAEGSEAAQALNARAFTIGHDVVFAPGEFEPDTKEGKKLLAHEMAHVVQQQKSPELAGTIQCQLITPLGPGGGLSGLMERDRKPGETSLETCKNLKPATIEWDLKLPIKNNIQLLQPDH